MIATKSYQHLSELLNQEELIRSVAQHYHGLTKESEIRSLYEDIICASEKNSNEILSYLSKH